MAETATTSEPTVETTPQETSTAASETAVTDSGEGSTPATGEERSTDSSAESKDDFQVNVNLDEVPREFRPHVEKYVKKYEKDFKSAYTKKSQERSESVRQAQAAAQKASAELQQVYGEIQDALRNPEKLDAYRKLILKEQNQHLDTNKIPENITTVEQLLEYNQRTLQDNLARMEQKVVQTTEQRMAHKAMEQRWDAALNSLKGVDKKFQKYERFVANLIQTDPKYKSLYNGANEEKVLKAAYDDFKSYLREDMEEVRDKTQKELTKKASSTTLTPQKTVATSSGSARPSMEETLARIRARLGES